MAKQTLRDAYAEFHRRDKAEQEWRSFLRRAWKRVEYIETDILYALAEQKKEEDANLIAAYTEMLKNDRAFDRVLRRYNGNKPRDWEWACGCDGRLRKLIRKPGWDVLKEVIRNVRIEKGIIRIKDVHVTKPNDATLEIKIKLGAV